MNVHYVVGIPTSAVEMAAIGGTVGTYALSGFTYPTAYNSSTGITTVGTLPLSGSLTANFGGSGSVSGNLNIPLAGNDYGMSWSGWDFRFELQRQR